jgi:uncharacterized membrane protein YtjA (UPF0391 family)
MRNLMLLATPRRRTGGKGTTAGLVRGLQTLCTSDLALVTHALYVITTEPVKGEQAMLRWALIFFVVALIAAFFGYGGIAGAAAGIAEILFFVFLVVAAIALIMGLARGRI